MCFGIRLRAKIVHGLKKILDIEFEMRKFFHFSLKMAVLDLFALSCRNYNFYDVVLRYANTLVIGKRNKILHRET